MEKKDTLEVVKKIAGTVGGIGAMIIAGAAIGKLGIPTGGILKRIAIAAGGYGLIGVAADAAQTKIENDIDDMAGCITIDIKPKEEDSDEVAEVDVIDN